MSGVAISDSRAGFIKQIGALSPGEVENYTASYTPTNCGPNTSTVSVTAVNACNSGITVSNSVILACPVGCELPQPVTILDPHVQGTNFVFSFQTKTGFLYTVQFTPSLLPVNWQLLSNVPGTGGIVIFQDSVTPTQRYYRVLTQ